MKNGLLIWNIALTLIAGYLVFDHFSSGKKEATATKTVSKDPPAANTGFRIAYFDMDSVENNFNMVKKARQEIDGREKKYNNDVAAMEMDRQQRIEGYQKRNMNQAEIEEARSEIAHLDDYNRQKKQDLFQELQEFRNKKQLYLQSLIKEFLEDYNKDKTYTYIFANDHGLFYYCDTAYNITGDIISRLNERYSKEYQESTNKENKE